MSDFIILLIIVAILSVILPFIFVLYL